MNGDPCKTPTSFDFADDLLAGKKGAWWEVVAGTALRAALIAGGLALVGDRKRLLTKSLAAALVVEAFVVAKVARDRACRLERGL